MWIRTQDDKLVNLDNFVKIQIEPATICNGENYIFGCKIVGYLTLNCDDKIELFCCANEQNRKEAEEKVNDVFYNLVDFLNDSILSIFDVNDFK